MKLKMIKYVIDTSALLALIQGEKGSDTIVAALPDAIMSSVNIAEAATVLMRNQFNKVETTKLINSLIKDSIVFDQEQAFETANIKAQTKLNGLSLGDCACLSLAKLKNLPVLTADKIWSKLNIDIEIKFIR